MFHFRVLVSQKTSIYDPQEDILKHAIRTKIDGNIFLESIYEGYEFSIDSESETEAMIKITELCNGVLVDPISQNYKIEKL